MKESKMLLKANSLGGALLLVFCAMLQAAGDDPALKRSDPTVAEPLPDFESTDDECHVWKSADHVGKKVLVLYFYPGDFTGGCSKQAQAYRDALAKFEELGAEVVGVSGDDVATHAMFKQTFALKHTLLADRGGDMAKLLGVPVTAGQRRVRAVTPDRKPLLGADGKAVFVERPVTLARWTMVVDREGKIACLRNIVHAETDSDEVLKVVEALSQ
jgi:peroxiredoxin Q/BCP